MRSIARFMDARNTAEGKFLSILLSVLLVFSFLNVTMFTERAGADETVESTELVDQVNDSIEEEPVSAEEPEAGAVPEEEPEKETAEIPSPTENPDQTPVEEEPEADDEVPAQATPEPVVVKQVQSVPSVIVAPEPLEITMADKPRPESSMTRVYVFIELDDPSNNLGGTVGFDKWYTIGYVELPSDELRLATECKLHDAADGAAQAKIETLVNSNSINRLPLNKGMEFDYEDITWNTAKVASSAAGYAGEDGKLTWHLDGKLTVRAKYDVTVKYAYHSEDGAPAPSDLPDTYTESVKAGQGFTKNTPHLDGYVADLSVVRIEKVMGNQVVTVTYHKDSNGNGVPDCEETYTVKYQSGDHGSFVGNNPAEAVFPDILTGSQTPVAPSLTAAAGWVFEGWEPEVANTVTEDVTYIAQWKIRDDVPYTVQHFQQKLDGSYELADAIDYQGTTDALVKARPKQHDGFTLNLGAPDTVAEGVIAGDGSLVLKLYYDRNSYQVAYEYEGTVPAGALELPQGATYKYGETVKVADPAVAQGYTFSGWKSAEVAGSEFAMPAQDVTLKGSWAANADTKYTVEYYYMKDGEYADVADSSVKRAGTTDVMATMTEDDKRPALLGYAFDAAAANVESAPIAGDGSTTLKVYFKQQLTVSYLPGDHGAFEMVTHEALDYGTLTPDAPLIAGEVGYQFEGWAPARETKVTADASYEAQWSEDHSQTHGLAVTVRYWLDNEPVKPDVELDDDGNVISDSSVLFDEASWINDALTYIPDAEAIASEDKFPGYNRVRVEGLQPSYTLAVGEAGEFEGQTTKTIDVYYEKRTDLSYAVEYYLDGVRMTDVPADWAQGETGVTFGSTQSVNPAPFVRVDDAQYRLTSTDHAIEIGVDNNVIRVDYEKINMGEAVFAVESLTKTYDGEPLTTTDFTVVGLDRAHHATATVTGERTNVGTTELTISDMRIFDENNVDVTNNYTVLTVPGTLTVEPRPVTITVDDATKLLGMADPAFTGRITAGSLVDENDLGLVTFARTNTDQVAGVYGGVLTANYTANPNYAVTVEPGDLTIMVPAPLPTPVPVTPVPPTPVPTPTPAPALRLPRRRLPLRRPPR